MPIPALAFPHRTRVFAVVLIVGTLGGLGWLWWLCRCSDAIAFLPAHRGAEWIVCPEPSNGYAYPQAPATTAFRRTFSLSATPGKALLEVRAFRGAAVVINGQPAGTLKDNRHWKASSTLDVTRLLRAGTNEITTWVTNSLGPPALWLRLQAGQETIGSDEGWQAFRPWAGWQQARSARRPERIASTSSLAGGERTVDALKRSWAAVAGLFALSLVIVLGVHHWLQGRLKSGPDASGVSGSRLIYALLGVVLIARAALVLNDLPQLPGSLGFDASAHEDYIRFIQQSHSLPHARQGWEMYQPPLYYAGSALLLGAYHVSLPDDRARFLSRLFNGAVGLVHCWLALLCLRLLFPASLAAQAAGLLVVAFLPPHLYLSLYVTNEPLSALFITLALYLCLRILCAEGESLRHLVGLGLALGAALLTKASALLAVPVFLAALGLRLVAHKRYAPSQWLRTAAAVIVPCLLVCGWYYGRVWAEFGRPIVGNWDADAGLTWWQDPGFRTSAFYFGFGGALVSPIFSAFHSFGDGLYSTLWGDGLISGTVRMLGRPPWNYDLMCLDYLLALGISLLLLAGVVVALGRFLRTVAAQWFLMVGLVVVYGLGILYMSLRVPSYAQVKAFYALPALVPLAALIGAGWEWLLRQRGRPWSNLPWILLVAWSTASYTAFWVRRDNPETHVGRGIALAGARRYSEAVASFERALRLQPDMPDAHMALGQALLEQGDLARATAELNAALKLQPDHPEAHYHLGYALLRQQRVEAAVAEFRQVLRLRLDWSPETLSDMARLLTDHPGSDPAERAETRQLAERACRLALHLKPALPEAHHTLGVILVQEGALGEAAAQFEAAVRAQPDDPQAHYDLGDAFLRQDQTERAVAEYREALRGKSDWPPEALNNMAWVLATHPQARLRDGPKALELAQAACRLAGDGNVSFLQTLAAAQAECGRFTDAVNTASRAYELAVSTGQVTWTNTARQRIAIYAAHKRLYEVKEVKP